MSKVIGIDLGTTNSLVAMVQHGKPVCLTDDAGDAIVPSVVHYAADGDIIVSTSPKCGTTWAQMLCALLIFQDQIDGEARTLAEGVRPHRRSGICAPERLTTPRV